MAITLVLCFCLAFPGQASSVNLTVSAVGKDAATAELNARVAAVRQTLQNLAAKDWLSGQTNKARETFISRSTDYTSEVKILSSTKEKNLVRIQAAVEVDEQKMRDTLLSLSPKALSEAAKKMPPTPKESTAAVTEKGNEAPTGPEVAVQPAQTSEVPGTGVTASGQVTIPPPAEPSAAPTASAEAGNAKDARTPITLLKPLCDVTAAAVTFLPEDRSITYTDVRVVADKEDVVFVIDKLVLTGIDQNSFDGAPGELSTVDKIVLSGCKILQREKPLAILEDYVIEGYVLNYHALLQILQNSKEVAKEQIALKLAPIFKDFKVAKVHGKNLTLNIAPATASIDSFEARDMSMGSYGPSVLNNFQVSLMGSSIFSMGKMGCSSVKMPQILLDMMADPEGYLANNQDLTQKLAQDPLSLLSPFEIKDFYLADIIVSIGAPFTLKKFSTDISIQDGELRIKNIANDLLVKRDVIAAVPSLAPLMNSLQPELQFNALVDCILRIKQGRADFAVDTNFREKALGSFALALGLDIPLAGMEKIIPGTPEQESSGDDSSIYRVKHFDLNVNNNGIVDLAIACYTAFDSETGGYEALRKNIIDTIEAALPTVTNKFHKTGLDALGKLLKEGGSLKTSLMPSQPVDINEILIADDKDLEGMGLNIIYQPSGGTQ